MTDVHTHDAAPRRRRDPTRTTALRTAFNADAQLRLRSLRSQLRLAIIERGLLGNGTFQAPSDRFRQFSNWFDYVATAELAAGQWSVPWIVKAVLAGQARANAELSNSIVLMTTALDPLDHLMDHELEGITAALKQKVLRLAAAAVRVNNLRPAEIFRIVSEPFADDISHRLKAFVNTMTVQAFNIAKLQVYRQAGISKVGIVPESLPPKPLVHDAKNDDEEDLVGVRTAGDDLVCEECDDIADGAPYALDEIEGLLPAHPHCRCTVYPWFDKRFKRDGAIK